MALLIGVIVILMAGCGSLIARRAGIPQWLMAALQSVFCCAWLRRLAICKNLRSAKALKNSRCDRENEPS
jgi:hypothetical protein